jgi:hypothetical protein
MALTFLHIRVRVGAQFAYMRSSKIDQTTDRSYGADTGSCSGYINVMHTLYIAAYFVVDNSNPIIC